MSNITLASTTSSQEELDHAASENWREPFVPKPAEEKAAVEEVAAEPEAKEEEKAAPPKGHKGGGIAKRIDKLTAQNAALSKELEELRAKVKPAEEKPESTAPKEPKLADYGNDIEKWTNARDAWKKSEEVRLANEETQKATFESYNKKVSEARGQYDDWDEVVSGASNINIPQAAYVAIVESDNGPDVAYYLATHPDESATLIEMSPTASVRAVGKISDKLMEQKAKPEPKAKVKPPEPLTPVGSSAARTNIPLEELPPREYIRIRNKQERENRGR